MPKKSGHQQYLCYLHRRWKRACNKTIVKWLEILSLPHLPTIGTILGGDSQVMALIMEWLFHDEYHLNNMFHQAIANWYMTGRQAYRFHEEYNLPTLLGMRDNDFKQVGCTTQGGFLHIYEMIQNSPLFKNQSNCPQLNACLQLALTLERLGCNGNGASLGRLARSYGIS
ncbi:hypothetical protein O181_105907 [Austropuccinia psidii MF-1]|uniref:Uncharacterized protein n=1 Tax=Austropuccinia psidii MF-1 TaxID=1389203 RepID=A0A9Q3JQZ6_9BASI|nr:hypothetical protein [Austropuccinia psidii MF-1]